MGKLTRKMGREKEKPLAKAQAKQMQVALEKENVRKRHNHQLLQQARQAEVDTFYKMAILTNWVLHDKFGFGGRGENSRLLRFQDEMAKLCAHVYDPKCGISVEGLNEALKVETGFDTVWHLNKRRYGENAEVV